jgi:hypothetical protein
MMFSQVLVELGWNQTLHAQLDEALFRINGEDLGFNGLANFEHFLRVIQPLLVGDFADMDPSLDTLH